MQAWPQHTGTLDHFCMLWWKVPKTTKGTNSLCQIIIAVMFGVLKKQRKNLGFGLYICICVCVCVYLSIIHIYKYNENKNCVFFSNAFILHPGEFLGAAPSSSGLQTTSSATNANVYIYVCVCVFY